MSGQKKLCQKKYWGQNIVWVKIFGKKSGVLRHFRVEPNFGYNRLNCGCVRVWTITKGEFLFILLQHHQPVVSPKLIPHLHL